MTTKTYTKHAENMYFYKKLFALVLPITFQNIMMAAVNAADIVMLGFVSQTALSAVSLAGQVQFVLSLFYSGLTLGTTILASQYWGKGEKVVVEKVLGLAIKLSVLISTMFSIGGIFFPEAIMHIFTSDPELIQTGRVYLQIVGFSYFLMSISQMYLCVMKNIGQAILSTIIGSTAMLLNIFLNGVFIFGWFGIPKLGVAGVALATTLSRLAELTWCLAESFKGNKIKIHMKYIIFNNKELFHDFFKYSSPVLADHLIWGCGFTMYSVIMGHLGSDAVAANSIANMVKNLTAALGLGVASGGAILLGTELGKNNLERAKEYGGRLVRTAILCGALGGVIILLAKPWILNLTDLTETAKHYLNSMLYICAYYIIGKSINSTVISGVFCAGGDTRFGVFCDTLDMWFFAVPLGFFCAFVLKMPIIAVYFIIGLDEFVKLPFVYQHYKKYGWVKDLTREL